MSNLISIVLSFSLAVTGNSWKLIDDSQESIFPYMNPQPSVTVWATLVPFKVPLRRLYKILVLELSKLLTSLKDSDGQMESCLRFFSVLELPGVSVFNFVHADYKKPFGDRMNYRVAI